MKTTKSKTLKNKNTELKNTFFKHQFLQSKKYSKNRILIESLLSPDLTYSKDDVDNIIKNYLEGEI